MHDFKIEIVENEPVIDSRIVAESLGINHSDWVQNVLKKHMKGFSVFKTEKVVTEGRPQKFYYLNEEQALFAATLSRNTQQVVEFKHKLVRSFIAARDIAKTQNNIPEEWKSLLPHTTTEVQKQSSKLVNAHNFKDKGKMAAIEWNRKNCKARTKNGFGPSELIKWAKDAGVPAKHRTSGKEVVRFFAPHKASAMSVADIFVTNGVEEDESIKLSKMLEEPFKKMREIASRNKVGELKPF